MRQLNKGLLSVSRLAPHGDDGIRTSFGGTRSTRTPRLWSRTSVCSSEIFAVPARSDTVLASKRRAGCRRAAPCASVPPLPRRHDALPVRALFGSCVSYKPSVTPRHCVAMPGGSFPWRTPRRTHPPAQTTSDGGTPSGRARPTLTCRRGGGAPMSPALYTQAIRRRSAAQ
jgi:hypothetical protein